MKKITKITPEQAASFGEWSKQWIEIGLSTEPADFDKATDAALRGYAAANFKRPMIILRMSSPYGATLGGALAWQMLREIPQVESHVGSQVWSQVWLQVESHVGSQIWSQVGSQVESQVKSQVWAQVRSQVRSQVLAHVGSQVWSHVESQVESHVRSQVKSQVWAHVGSQVWSQVGLQVWSQVGSQVKSQVESHVGSHVGSQVWSHVGSQVWSQVESQVRSQATNNSYHGNLWASWGAYVSFIRDVLKWDDPVLEKFSIDEDLIKSCGWVWWHENVLAISDRPALLKRDAEGRLHSESGPSIAYRDGWALHHWHGTSIPREWIEDRASLTPKIAITWANIEQRRAACEMLGWASILNELKAKTIDTDGDPEIGELVEVSIPDVGKEKFLRVLCGTKREFALPMPPHIKTALQGQACLWGLDKKTFIKPEIRT